MASEMIAWAEAECPRERRKASSRPVDLVHLSRYTLGERKLEREVPELLSFRYIDQLKQCPSDKDWKDLTHRPKGSARAVGAWRVAKAAELAEPLTGEAFAHSRAGRIEEIDASLREAEAYIKSLLEDR